MKAIITTTMMLMAISFAALEASAQSAERNTPQSSKQRKIASAVSRHSESRQSTYSNSRTPSQKSNQSRVVQNTRKQSPSRTVTTTTNNPRSTYKGPSTVSRVGKTVSDPRSGSGKYTSRTQNPDNHSSNNGYRSTWKSHSYKHYYYPNKSVKVHIHPATYQSRYRVMYYPVHRDIIWTSRMNRYYIGLYPGIHIRYPIGYSVKTLSAFDARYNIGEVSRVYGRVYGTWFNRETDDLLLFFGGEYPHQEFTMIIPGSIARRYSWRPERYFLGQHVIATGYISSFEGNPEIVIKKRDQLDIY